MKTKLVAVLAVSIGLLQGSGPVQAHHAFAAEYDRSKPVELKGTVTQVEWVNPHAWIRLDVKDETGEVANWACEMGSPNLLTRSGWRRDTLKPGDAIIVNGSAAKSGAHVANARTVRLANGQRVFNAGSSGGDQ